MNARRDPDRIIKAFLDDGVDELPGRSYDAVRTAIDETRQWVVIGPWREQRMNRLAILGTVAVAIVLAVAIGTRFLPSTGGIGGQPATAAPPTAAATPSAAATPTAASTPTAAPPTAAATPTASPASSAAPIADPIGRLQPGTYVAHPFDTLLGMDARAFSFTTPSANWEAHGDPGRTFGVVWNDGSGDSEGVGVGFLKVHSLNGDACKWSGTADDIAIGPTVANLLEALTVSDNFDTDNDFDFDFRSGMAGSSFELTMPATLQDPAVGCDDQAYRIWNAEGFDIFAQGPSNVWALDIVDVGGERYVILASYMSDTSAAVRDELASIFRSVQIDSSPGCPQYAHTCN